MYVCRGGSEVVSVCGCDCVGGVCDCVGVSVIVWVWVCVIAWVSKGVCGWYSLNYCCKVCVWGSVK